MVFRLSEYKSFFVFWSRKSSPLMWMNINRTVGGGSSRSRSSASSAWNGIAIAAARVPGFSGCDSGCGRWSRRCPPRSWSWRQVQTSTGGRGPYVSLLTHSAGSCRTFHSPLSAPPIIQRQPLLLHNHNLPQTNVAATPRHTTTTIFARQIPKATRRFPSFLFRRSYSSSSTMAESELKWPAARVRQTFLEYFEQRGHTIGMR